jgi:hypothetical protein
MDSNFQYAGAVNLVIAPFVQPRRRAARTQARVAAMPATCSCYRVGPDAETVCSRCARMSRCPGGGCTHAPYCFYFANSRLRATARVAAARASRSKLSASSKTALLAPGSVNCPATSRACSARSSHSKASFNGDGIRSSHSVYKTVSFRRGGRLAPSRQLFVHENGGLGTWRYCGGGAARRRLSGGGNQSAALERGVDNGGEIR